MDFVRLAYLSAFFIFIVFSSVAGLIRGAKRGVYRLVLMILAFVSALLLFRPFTDFIIGVDLSPLLSQFAPDLAFTTLESFLGNLLKDAAENLFAGLSLPATTDLSVALVKIALSLISYWLLFAVFNALLYALYLTTKKFVDKSKYFKKTSKNNRIFGTLAGLLSGILLSFIVFTPLLGVSDLAAVYFNDPDFRELVSDEYAFDDGLPDEIGRFVNYNGAVKFLFGGSATQFLDWLTTVELADGSISTADIRSLDAIIDDAAFLVKNRESLADPSRITEELYAEALARAKNISLFFFDSVFSTPVLTDGLNFLYDENIRAELYAEFTDDEIIPLFAERIFAEFFADGKPTKEVLKNFVTSIFDFADEIASETVYILKNIDALSEITVNQDLAPNAIENIKSLLAKTVGQDYGFIGLVLNAGLDFIASEKDLLLGGITDENLKPFIDVAWDAFFGGDKPLADIKAEIIDLADFALDVFAENAALVGGENGLDPAAITSALPNILDRAQTSPSFLAIAEAEFRLLQDRPALVLDLLGLNADPLTGEFALAALSALFPEHTGEPYKSFAEIKADLLVLASFANALLTDPDGDGEQVSVFEKISRTDGFDISSFGGIFSEELCRVFAEHYLLTPVIKDILRGVSGVLPSAISPLLEKEAPNQSETENEEPPNQDEAEDEILNLLRFLNAEKTAEIAKTLSAYFEDLYGLENPEAVEAELILLRNFLNDFTESGVLDGDMGQNTVVNLLVLLDKYTAANSITANATMNIVLVFLSGSSDELSAMFQNTDNVVKINKIISATLDVMLALNGDESVSLEQAEALGKSLDDIKKTPLVDNAFVGLISMVFDEFLPGLIPQITNNDTAALTKTLFNNMSWTGFFSDFWEEGLFDTIGKIIVR